MWEADYRGIIYHSSFNGYLPLMRFSLTYEHNTKSRITKLIYADVRFFVMIAYKNKINVQIVGRDSKSRFMLTRIME